MKYRIIIRDEKGREYIIHAENKENLEQRMEYLNKAYATSLNDYTLGLISLNLEGTMFLRADAIYSIEIQEIPEIKQDSTEFKEEIKEENGYKLEYNHIPLID